MEKPKRKPSKKQETAVKYLATHPEANVTEAMRLAGYEESTIDKPGQNFTGAPGVQALAEDFGLVLERYVPKERIARKIAEMMEAKKTTNAVILLTKDGETIKAEEQGLIEVDDNSTQLKATELAMRGHSLLSNTSINVTQNNITQYNDVREEMRQIIGAK